ncbi:hypothetical protein COCOBI_04-5320 [Coccomyxa sp. Obi]|nr:hypothetical protein COCOBI_04-5320 [Coccomyxa sp. Obi]
MRVNVEVNCCKKTTRTGIRRFSAQHNLGGISEIQESRREEVQAAGRGSGNSSSEEAEGRQRRARKSVKKAASKEENTDQQGKQDSHAQGQDKRQKPHKAAEAQEATQPGVASKKGPPSALTSGASPRSPQKPQQKRRQRARKKSAGSKEQHIADSQKQATGSHAAGPTLQHDGLQGETSDPQTLHAESRVMSTAPPNHVEQTRQGEVLPSEQPASLQPEVTEPILAGQTVQLGSQDSLAFLMGLGLSAEAASHVLSTALSAASDKSAGKYASEIPAWQMEAVCRTLVDLRIKVRDLGQLFVRCPALLSCRADELRQRAEHINAVLGESSNKISKEACLANLLTIEPGIMVDQGAMERLQLLASQVHRIGKGLPEECSSALCAIAYKRPEVFGKDTVELLQSIRFLTLQLQVDGKGVLTLFTSHPDVLIRGTASLFEALLAILPMQKAELKAVVREHPLIMGVELERAASVVKMLRAAGLNDDELRQLVQAFPGVLSKRPKDVQVKLAFLTKLLGQPAESMLGAPRLFFNKSVVSNIGPRFSFIKDCLPDCTTQWAPTTILRSSDEDFCMLIGAPVEQYAIYKKQWQEANGRRFRSSK